MATQYSWEQAQIDDNFLNQFASADNASQFLTGNLGVGAQSQDAALKKMGEVQKAITQKWQQATQQLASVNPAFDPKHYLLDKSLVYDFGEGAGANRDAIVMRPQLQLQSYQKAIQMAQAAAQRYEQTGTIDPYPSMKELAAQAFPYNAGNETALNNIVNRASGNISPQDQEKANAAAARVGSPLPYPTSKIGQIVPGGLFTNQDIQNAQTQGMNYDQISQQARQGSFQNQPSEGFSAGGTGTTQQGQPSQSNQPQRSTYAEGAAGDQQYQNALSRWQQTSGSQGSSTGTTTGTSTGATGTSGSTGTATGSNGQATTTSANGSIQAALDVINKSSWDEGTKALLRQSVGLWKPGDEFNLDNVVKTFEQIKSTTLSPYFQELSNSAIDEAKRASTFMEGERSRQLEAEGTNASQAIRGSQNDLEARGMTFSGEGVNQLGAKSAFAQPGTPEAQQSAIPLQTSFGGKYAEGLVNQSNRLISSSSQAQYQKNLTDLSRGAEQQLGTAGSAGLVAGVAQLGGVKESAVLPSQQKQAEASTLMNLYNQEAQNVEARKPVEVFKNS